MTLAAFAVLCAAALCGASDHPSHLKPFGVGNVIPVEEIEGFPPVEEFFEKYARKNLPVVMRGANKEWPGFENWKSDEYFKSVAPAKPFMISMDKKRGNPDGASKFVDFKQFLELYNSSSRRMIERTPDFLETDVLVPGCLDCDVLTQGTFIMGNKMWFGFNYTTSVVHKDAADNINCLVYGVKNYTMVSADQSHSVYLDRPDGLYSTMKVDKVDFDKYPGLENIEYQHTELHGGDCIFVPYKWIHQVRSYGRNIAVNIWWNYWKNNEVDLTQCPKTTEKKHDITYAKFHGWGDFETREEGVKEHLIDLIWMVREDMNLARFSLLFTIGLDADDSDVQYVDKDIREALKRAHKIIDANKDGKVNIAELKAVPEDKMKKVIKHIRFVFYATRVRATNAVEEDRNMEYEKQHGQEQPQTAVDEDDDGEDYEHSEEDEDDMDNEYMHSEEEDEDTEKEDAQEKPDHVEL